MLISNNRCRPATNSIRMSVRAALFGGVIASLGAPLAALAADPDSAQTELEEVIVTGSLIRSSNQTSSSPIVTAGMEDLARTGDVSLIANLNQLPQFNAQSGVFSGGQGTGGRVTINLRGLVSYRNLVLLDGRRLP